MKKTIEAYSLAEFVQLVQAQVQDGWEIDFEDNDSIPVSWTGYYKCKMHKGKQVAALFLPPEPETPDVPPTVQPEPDVYKHLAQPFVPSVVFEVAKPVEQTTKKVGRPKQGQI